MGDEVIQVFGVGREQHQRAEAGRADGIALGDGLGGVADGVERVGGLAYVAFKTGHLGDAAGIVGHRAEGIERHDHARQRQHRRHRDGDAEQARPSGRSTMMPAQITSAGIAVEFHRNGQTLDDIGAMAGDGGLRDHLAPGGIRCRCSIR